MECPYKILRSYKDTPHVMSDRMFELADRLKELKESKKQAEQRVKDINASIDGVDYELSELMAQTETQSFSRAGTLFYLTILFNAANIAYNNQVRDCNKGAEAR